MNLLQASGAAAVVALVAATTASPPPASPWDGIPPTFTMTEVVPPIDQDPVYTHVTGINDDGRLAAYSFLDSAGTQTIAFALDAGGYTILRRLKGAACAITLGVGPGGQPFGLCGTDVPHDARGTTWTLEGTPQHLEQLPFHQLSMALDRGTFGDLVGASAWSAGFSRPVRWLPPVPEHTQSGSTTVRGIWLIEDLGTPGFQFGEARGISTAADVVVGTVWNAWPAEMFYERGAVWRGDTFEPIGVLPGGSFSRLNAVNDLGEAVGVADKNGVACAIRFDTGSFLFQVGDRREPMIIQPLPGDTYLELVDINDFGAAVGYSGKRAVVSFGDRLFDLNELVIEPDKDVPVQPTVTLVRATGINNKGQIVGHGLDALERQVGFVLTPTR